MLDVHMETRRVKPSRTRTCIPEGPTEKGKQERRRAKWSRTPVSSAVTANLVTLSAGGASAVKAAELQVNQGPRRERWRVTGRGQAGKTETSR